MKFNRSLCQDWMKDAPRCVPVVAGARRHTLAAASSVVRGVLRFGLPALALAATVTSLAQIPTAGLVAHYPLDGNAIDASPSERATSQATAPTATVPAPLRARELPQ